MDDIPASCPNKKIFSYNPISKIQQIIHCLDHELLELVPNYKVGNLEEAKLKAQREDPNTKKNKTVQKSVFNIEAPIENTDKIEMRMILNYYNKHVAEAFQKRLIFTIYGNYYTLRYALLKRGWIEKLTRSRYANLQALPEEAIIKYVRPGNEFESVMLSNMMNRYPPFFIWQPKAMRDMYSEVLPYRNRIRRRHDLDFSTKIGLIGCSEQAFWYRKTGVCGMRYPRFYRLGGTSAERLSFIEDFCLTQCRNFIRFLWNNFSYSDLLVDHEYGSEPMQTLLFAMKCLEKQLNEFEHSDLDDNLNVKDTYTDSIEWQNFIKSTNNIIFKKAKLKMSVTQFSEIINKGKLYLQKIFKKHPDFQWDGCRNLWILKPGFRGCGFGIIVRNNLEEILEFASMNSNRRYIVQKYIERPYLIYKTKFDIRMYMLLSIDSKHVLIWIYKDCYLRFSSHEFNMTDLREVIHLTNNSVQKKYKNYEHRDKRLPLNNMWSLKEFKDYLNGLPETETIWSHKIYPGFSANLIAVVMASLEETHFVENTFELFGCDFMLDEEFNPILIEINATPDLSRSTKVTATICPMMLKDMLKVIVDLPKDPETSTGLFDLAFKVRYKPKSDFEANKSLNITGEHMQTNHHTFGKPMSFKRAIDLRNSNITKQDRRYPSRIRSNYTFTGATFT